jgi:hypothetical protein
MEILKLYQKPNFSSEDNQLINKAIDEGVICADDIKEDCMNYIYQKLNEEGIEVNDIVDIWRFTDENLENGITHEENYQNLKNFLFV